MKVERENPYQCSPLKIQSTRTKQKPWTDLFCYPRENLGVTEINTLVGCKKILSDVLFYLLNKPKVLLKAISATGLKQMGSFWSQKMKRNMGDIFQKLPSFPWNINTFLYKINLKQLTVVFLKLSFCFPWEYLKAESSSKKPFGSFSLLQRKLKNKGFVKH